MSRIKMSNVPFRGTPEQEKQLIADLQELKGTAGAVLPSLQKAQAIYGYLPIEVQRVIANELEVSLEEVFGVSTFYSQFSLSPKGEYRVSVCLGTACYVKGAGQLFDKCKESLKIEGGQCTPDGRFSLDATRCIGCCGLAPVMTVNEDVYGKVLPDEIEGILAKYQA